MGKEAQLLEAAAAGNNLKVGVSVVLRCVCRYRFYLIR